MHYLRLFRTPRTVVLLVDVLCSVVAAALLPRLDPVVFAVDAAVFDDAVPDVVVGAVGAGIVVVGVIVTELLLLLLLLLLFDDVPLLIITDDDVA